MDTWKLPPEVDDIILDHLHDDHATLANCALVRRSWLPTARYHCWRDLRLTCSEKGVKELEGMLDASITVVCHVQSIVLSQKKGDVCQWYDLHLLHTTLATLSRFPSLTSFTLDGLWFGVSRQGQVRPCHVTFPSVRRLCISSCTFDAFDDIQQLCNAFPALSCLQFDGVWWGRWNGDQAFVTGIMSDASPSTSALKELDLGSCFSRDKIIDWLLTSLPKSSVETLRLPLVGAYDTRLKDLLKFVGSSLRHLELGSPSSSTVRHRVVAPGEYRALDSYLDMSQNTGLRSIQLGVPTYRDPQFITLWLATVLSQVASPVLEEVRFAVYPILRGDAGDAVRMLDAYDWPAVVDVLQKPQFAMLRKVVFVSGRSTEYVKISEAFVPLQPVLQKAMPSLFERVINNGVELTFKCI